jgi:hypothetical protein
MSPLKALNVDKCEASISPSFPADSTHTGTGYLLFPLPLSVKCYGAWWSPNLSCTKWVEETIKKAGRAFFARDSGVFHGTLNPLSSKVIVKINTACYHAYCLVPKHGFLIPL